MSHFRYVYGIRIGDWDEEKKYYLSIWDMRHLEKLEKCFEIKCLTNTKNV